MTALFAAPMNDGWIPGLADDPGSRAFALQAEMRQRSLGMGSHVVTRQNVFVTSLGAVTRPAALRLNTTVEGLEAKSDGERSGVVVRGGESGVGDRRRRRDGIAGDRRCHQYQ